MDNTVLLVMILGMMLIISIGIGNLYEALIDIMDKLERRNDE